jgi:hypothetical protein
MSGREERQVCAHRERNMSLTGSVRSLVRNARSITHYMSHKCFRKSAAISDSSRGVLVKSRSSIRYEEELLRSKNL